MLNTWQAASAFFDTALSGMATPAVIAVALALTTLLVEDVAIAAGVALATQGSLSWGLSLLAVGGGIALGDLGLYGLGLAANRVPWLRRRFIGARADLAREHIVRRLGSAVLLARVIPGLRLLNFTACGFVRVSVLRFSLWVVLAVTLWTLGLYLLSFSIGHAIANATGLPPTLAVALPILALALALPLWRWLRQSRRNRGAPVIQSPRP